MASLSTFAEECRSISADLFSSRHPCSFFVYSRVSGGSMSPVAKTRVPTEDRLVVGIGGSGPAGGPEDWYDVFPVRAENPLADRISLGCSSSCDVVLSDASVSRLHAWVLLSADGESVVDAESLAGTSVNGLPLETEDPVLLKSGDRVTIGTVDLIYLPAGDFYTFVRRIATL